MFVPGGYGQTVLATTDAHSAGADTLILLHISVMAVAEMP